MVTEIELKARVNNSESLRRILLEKALFLREFEKKDCYWFSCDSTLPPVRVRAEKRIFPDRKEETLTLATYKSKKVVDGLEINDEREFSVDPVSEFEDFLKRMAFKPGRFKEKRGWAFSKDGITAELVEVIGLGWFIELEITTDFTSAGMDSANSTSTDTVNEKNFAEERKRLLDLLSSLGISKEAIESRYYSEMLSDTANV